MNKKFILLLISIAALVLPAGFAQTAPSYEITIEQGVETKMRDGVILKSDIYRPRADGQFPVLLERTPYDKNGDVGSDSFASKAAAKGYVVIVQDVRGRYSSEGEWYPFLHESNDGYDTIEWAGTLPYSNGKVGMWGGSYVGATQMLAAITHPPHLAGINPVVTASNYHNGWTYQGGAFEQWFNESWTSGLAEDTVRRAVSKSKDPRKGVEQLPLTEYPLFNFSMITNGEQTRTLAPYFLDWLGHSDYDDYWKRWSIEEHFSDINVPVLSEAAWYDIFLGGSLRNYMGIKAHGGSDAARKGQRLLIAIGGHAGGGRKVGDVDFGPNAEFQEQEFTVEWYDYLFKGVQNQFAKEKPVKLFVLGANEWREEDDWPLPQARNTKYFLHSAGSANSSKGSGGLSTKAPAAEPFDHYVYDPATPVPTVGGPLCCDSPHWEPGARDQRALEEREDVLIYSTPALEQDMEVTGPVTLELYAKSSVIDTDFTAKLVDVGPDGFAQNLTEGIVRARYRDSQEKPDFMKPGEVYKFNIDLWATSNVFRKGHILRLEVSSSNFPRFDRNLNTGNDSSHARKYVTANNAIYHDKEHPSALVVPVIPGK
jgi:putative CocE/NonD family hydrolase